MMPIDFYHTPGSPPCTAVLLAASVIGVELHPVLINLWTGENKRPEYVKINPQCTVPAINDNGFVLCESRAINTYLQEQYGKTESLYPKDSQRRALVDQRLYFDMGTLYQRFADYYYPMFFAGADEDPVKLEKLNDAMNIFDNFLETSAFASGDNLTLADLSIVVTVANLEALAYDIAAYKNVLRWYKNVKMHSKAGSDIIEKSAISFKEAIENVKK